MIVYKEDIDFELIKSNKKRLTDIEDLRRK